jgi:hypothetical protein
MTASTALRRPRPTLMGLRGPSRTHARLRRVGIWFHPARPAFQPPLGHSADAPSHGPKPAGGPPWPSAPLQSSIIGTPRRPAGCPASQTTLPLLGFHGPTTQCQTGGPVRPQRIPPLQRTAYGVWLPPSRSPPPVLPTLARWSVHGLHPSRNSPRRDRCPSRGPCPPDVTRRTGAPPRGGGHGVAAFRALFPRRVRAVAGTTRVPAVDPFLGFILPERTPVQPGARFRRGASPLALRRLYV